MKSLTKVVLAVGMAIGMAACSTNNTPTETEATTTATANAEQGEWPRSVDSLVVKDGKAGKETEKVELTTKPERIVSTSVTLTGSLLAIDAPVVGTGGGQPGPVATDKGFFTQWAPEAEKQNVESLYILEPNLEKIVAQDPDLIFVSAAGADSATDIVTELKDIAPVVVVDYSNQSWQELMTQLGEATGQESQAKTALDSYEKRLTEVKNSITVPEQPTNFALTLPEGKGMNFWSTVSAQGQLLTDLGFDFKQPADEITDTSGTWAKRTDVKHVAAENIDKAINGKTLLVMNTDSGGDPVEQVKSNAQLANTDPVKNNAVYGLDPDVFRMDYYSALSMLDQVEELFQ